MEIEPFSIIGMGAIVTTVFTFLVTHISNLKVEIKLKDNKILTLSKELNGVKLELKKVKSGSDNHGHASKLPV